MTRYELLDRIGVGGMAEIFRGKAIAAGGFEKPVAIKRILPHLSQDKRFVELLIAEAKVLSLLKHRNITQIFDVGLGDDGKYFLVMEYVDGKDLGAIQRGLEAGRRRIPFDLALHVGAEICEALEHAHSARAPDGKPMSLVHRDVSPSNVLVSRAGEVKLTDFGIAKRAEQEATGHGAVRGKFAYISPEQARNAHVDPRSDVFSVGILLWELVTGRRLFSGLGDLEALRQVREARAPRPRELDGRLGADIDGLIMSALAPEPRGRPTAGQLGAQLRTLRYSLDVTVGDPATELAKIIDAADAALRDSAPAPTAPPPARLDIHDEATVIRIHTADAFSMRDQDGTGVARAREVIDRFEEDETRQAKLSRDQLAFLRATAHRDSGEMTSAAEPPLPGVPPPRRLSDEHTRMRPPLATEDVPTFPPPDAPTFLPDSGPNLAFDGDEATRLVAPPIRPVLPPTRIVAAQSRPTPPPELLDRTAPPFGSAASPLGVTDLHEPASRSERPQIANQPPAMPAMARRPPTEPPHEPPPGTIQARHVPPPSASQPMPPPALPPPVPLPQPPPGPPAIALAPPPYIPWIPPPPPPMRPIPRPPSQRAAGRASVTALGRRKPLKPWMLTVGALLMALLAFAVTRACIHTATRPAAAPVVAPPIAPPTAPK